MVDFKEREKRRWNEMSEKEKLINSKPLNAYETLDKDTHNLMLPGYQTTEERDNYRRYNKKGINRTALLAGHQN
jgi:hypothetical protein